MSMTFRFLSVLALVATTACIISEDDDDDGGDTSNTATASNTNNTASASDSTSVTATASESDGSSGSGSSGAADSSGSGTGGATGCGWGQLPGQKKVDEGYTCGGEGEDPKMVFPIACPTGVTLEDGLDCGGDMGVTGVGCCDGTTNWFCADDGSGPKLFSDPCV